MRLNAVFAELCWHLPRSMAHPPLVVSRSLRQSRRARAGTDNSSPVALLLLCLLFVCGYYHVAYVATSNPRRALSVADSIIGYHPSPI